MLKPEIQTQRQQDWKYETDEFKGICIIAGDISPIDVISHMAYYCEEQGVNYM